MLPLWAKGDIVLFFDAVDGRNARMVKAGEDFRLTLEPGETVWVSGKHFGEDLQRDIATQLGVGGLIHPSYPALADEGGHVLVAEAGTHGQRHGFEAGNT